MVLKLIKKLALYTLICLGIVTFFLETQGRHIDAFYEKFTTPKVNAMIVGDSRGFQGITPYVINEKLSSASYSLPIYNYSFTIGQAPIGPLYRKSILKKLKQEENNGLFLIALTPLMLSSNNENINEAGEFSERKEPPHNMIFVDKRPNYEYFIKNINYFEFKAMFKKEYTVHKDGWMEINHISKDKRVLKAWKNTQMDRFKEMAKTSSPSNYRLKSLDTLVQTLKIFGEVYLLRLPIDADFLDLEHEYFPDFNTRIDDVAKKNGVKYFNFGTTDTTDYFAFEGHHLDVESAELFSKNVSDSIIKYSTANK
ncbi:hypothetical protein ACFFU9_12660 [Mariniflexile ostreae]|uniref:SGNH/GDSL hydrolase family protein n=1 Tax=Mariniflexile ostreae TaxID=1520892 RepID=A0ABV5FDQ1_9FLAO